jgi:RNA polymerase sigma-70 factor (ECF subfamily)
MPDDERRKSEGVVTDRELEWSSGMRAANRGDAVAYARLLASLAPVLRGLARQSLTRTRLESDVEDVVQETLLAIHLKRHTWDETRPFGPWVRAIIRHKLVDAARRRGFRVEVPVDNLTDVLAAPIPDAERSVGSVERYLDELPARQKEVVRAVMLDGATVRNTASRLQTSEGNVRVALHRGLAALAARIRRFET